ncbi:MAG: sigma-54-dependent Fis family transcriptional regulator [Woeseia sp.]|nr:sigma-54 dependent transcriptional regulator [Woeseia sp.]MBT8096053.1 sigma-54 dependent transcriptional regulator [Woeseia sp.]NNE61489.1 sigma-54-dependent Fis family transcriptional regulator [Woeseia sp.]NNL54472.1 sigma-54-dependent Fis family transcriptional regulator [Woeseia sp.]
MDKPAALVIDDEPDILELLALTLLRMGINTTQASDVTTARTKLMEQHFDLCLTDMRLPDGDGLDLVKWMQANAPDVPVAVITAHGNVETAVQALKLGAFDFISKPLDLSNLRSVVENALKLPQDVAPKNRRLLGRSKALQELRGLIERVSRSQAPVHICGESGTGKELVARLIHESGPRAEGPFVPVNCGAIPTELMESEFFGHVKGSFTGAVSDKTGLLQSAAGGSLFLDEIADLPLAMQVKLLRVIQEQNVRPVGAEREEAIDVRILSATHRDLAEMVASGGFREDLFYRINVIELRVPALRERGDDVLLLAEHFLAKLGSSGDALDDSARKVLRNYRFPGNVRELENMLERSVTLCVDGKISAADLHVRDGAPPHAPAPASVSDATVSGSIANSAITNLGGQIEDIERQAIIDALQQTRYNKTAAARLLGLSFRQLRYRIKKFGIE